MLFTTEAVTTGSQRLLKLQIPSLVFTPSGQLKLIKFIPDEFANPFEFSHFVTSRLQYSLKSRNFQIQ